MLLVGLLAVAAPSGPAAVTVHAHLVASTPADGDTLRRPPAAIRLEFSEPIEAAMASIRVVGPDGSTIEPVAQEDPDDVRVVLAPLPALDTGGYRVVWRVVSADGHTVSGDYAFYVEGAEAALLPAAPPPPTAETAPTPPTAWRMVAEALGMATLLLFAGILLFIGPRIGSVPRLAAALALLTPLFLAGDFMVWALTVSPGIDLAGAMGRAARTTPGRIEMLRIGLVLLAGWALVLARRPRAAATIVLAAVVLSGALGHAQTRSSLAAIPAKAVHLAAVAAWLGGLVRLATADPDVAEFPPLARRVSAVALICVLVIGATGILQAALLLPDPTALWGSGYGRLVLVKAGGLASLVAIGAYHRLRLMPRLEEGRAPDLRRSVRREIVLMALVVLVAAWLAQVPPPEAAPATVLTGGAR